MKKVLLLLILILPTQISIAQKTSINIWDKKIQAAKTDTFKLKYCIQAASYFQNTNPDSSLFFLRKGESINRKIGTTRFTPDLMNLVGYYWDSQNDLDKATYYYRLSQQSAKQFSNIFIYQQATYNLIGINSMRGLYVFGIKQYLEFERTLNNKNATDSLFKRSIYINLSKNYFRLDNNVKSNLYAKKMLPYCQTTQDSLKYFELILMSTTDIDIAKYAYSNGNRLARKDQNIYSELSFNINYSDKCLKHKLFDKAISYCLPTIEKAKKSNIEDMAMYAYSNIAEAYSGKRQYQKALLYLKKIDSYLQKDEYLKYQVYGYLNHIYAALGDYKQAYKYNLELTKHNDEVKGIKNQQFLAEIEASNAEIDRKVEITKRELTNKNQKERIATEQKQKYWLMAGLFIMAILLVAALWNYIKVRKLSQKLKEKSLKLEQKTLDLEEINRSKDKLFGILSHDLREPLNELKAILMLFYSNDISQNKMVSLSKNINNKLFTLQMMLDNLLNWAVVQLKNDLNNSTVFELEPMLNQVIEQMNEQIDRKQIEIIREKTDLKINGNEAQLEIVFRNILSNAIKFSPIKGKVSINVQKQSEQVNIRITDSGMGIKEIQMDNIYNYPISQKGTAGEKGTGLGLRLSKELLEKNNGELLLSNENKGGLTAQIILSSV